MSYRASRSSALKSRSPPADISLDQHISASLDFADATYTSKEIVMPKLKEGYYAVIHDIEFEISDLMNNGQVASTQIDVQLSDEEESAVLQLDDEDLISKWSYQYQVGAAGTILLIQPIHMTPKLPILYPHDKIYLGVNSSAAGSVAGVCYIRIHYTVKQISDFMVNMVMKKK